MVKLFEFENSNIGFLLIRFGIFTIKKYVFYAEEED